MRYRYFLFLILFVSCVPQVERTKPSDAILDIYREQTARTDPGEYAYLYDNLPEDLDELCELIKKQLIHPQEAMQKGMDKEKLMEDNTNHDVRSMLHELVGKDSSGLTTDRRPADRLVLACYHHSMLLASILRSREIPVRMRAGYARYYEKAYNVRFGHIICEAWNEKEGRWMLVDPDRDKVDFSSREFDFAGQAYLNLKNRDVKAEKYTSTLGAGLRGAIHILSLDLSLITHEEKMNWQLPSIVLTEFDGFDELNDKEIMILDQLADLSIDPDAHLSRLKEVYSTNTFIQPSGITYEEWIEMVYGVE
jgi:hypothetical protein